MTNLEKVNEIEMGNTFLISLWCFISLSNGFKKVGYYHFSVSIFDISAIEFLQGVQGKMIILLCYSMFYLLRNTISYICSFSENHSNTLVLCTDHREGEKYFWRLPTKWYWNLSRFYYLCSKRTWWINSKEISYPSIHFYS